MGQYASEPVVEKDTQEYHNNNMIVGTSSMQGWRLSMEDSRTCLLSIPEDPEASFFGVFDGHGGSKIAEYASKHLASKIVNRPEYAEGNIEEAIKRAYLDLDEEMSKDVTFKDEVAGSTAISILVKENKIYCGNVGDSRAIVSVNGLSIDLSKDHKPTDKEEARRIICAGGWVSFDRVKGILAMSRALGDFPFKTNTALPPEQQMLTAYPDVAIVDIAPDTEFILLACDGIWDVMKNQEVVDFVSARIIDQRLRPQQICEDIMVHCLAPDTSSGNIGLDNMTIVIVALLKPDPKVAPVSYAEWCSRIIARRSSNGNSPTHHPLSPKSPAVSSLKQQAQDSVKIDSDAIPAKQFKLKEGNLRKEFTNAESSLTSVLFINNEPPSLISDSSPLAQPLGLNLESTHLAYTDDPNDEKDIHSSL